MLKYLASLNPTKYINKVTEAIEKMDYTEYEYLIIKVPQNPEFVTNDVFNTKDFKNLLNGLGYREVFSLMKLTNATFYIQDNTIQARLKKEHINTVQKIQRTIETINNIQLQDNISKKTYLDYVKEMYSNIINL